MSQPYPQLNQPLVILIRLEGKMVHHEHHPLETLITDLLEKSHRRFILDFKNVEFIDSAGIGLIMKIASNIEKATGELILCNPRTNVKNVFVMLGIETRFRIFDNLGDTLEHYGRLLNLEMINFLL